MAKDKDEKEKSGFERTAEAGRRDDVFDESFDLNDDRDREQESEDNK